MANELSIVVSVAFNKGGVSTQRSESISVDVAGDSFTHRVQAIETSNTEIDIGDAGTAGYVFIKNLDSTYYVQVGITSSYSVKLLPGECALFRAAGVLYAAAQTQACDIECWIIEE